MATTSSSSATTSSPSAAAVTPSEAAVTPSEAAVPAGAFAAVSTLPSAPTLTIHAAPSQVPTPPLAATLPTPTGNWTYIYTPETGGTLNESSSGNNFVLEGIGNRDYLIGGTGHNILDPGAGENTMTNGGTQSTLFVHHSGATDDVTNFHPGIDRLTTDAARHVVASGPGTIVDQNQGTTHSGLIVTFDDHSQLALQGVTGAFNSDWLVYA